jgi:ABC-type nickel/cobalt efflux system permease component RcnA
MLKRRGSGCISSATVMQPLYVVMIGFLLGMRHATDPDHVVAVATIVSRERRLGSALLIGAIWGIGHSLTILVVGGAIILFDLSIPPRLGLSMELSVAVLLIVLGAANLTGVLHWMSVRFGAAREDAPHVHLHRHGDHVHTHAHHHHGHGDDHDEGDHAIGRWAAAITELGLFQSLRPLIAGIVHGLAGSAAVALLVLATIPEPLWAMAYLLVFGVGTIAGMTLITAANAVPLVLTAARFASAHRYLGVASGVLSLSFGLFLAYQICFVDGLLAGELHWVAS